MQKYNFIVLLTLLFIITNGQSARASRSQALRLDEQTITQNATDSGSVRLIQFHDDVVESEADVFAASLGYELTAWLAPLHTAKVKVIDTQSLSAAQAMSSSDGSSSAVPVSAASISAASMAIISIETESQAHGTGQDPALAVARQSYGLRNISAPEAWAMEVGSSNTVIAVIDTGLDMDNPEFIGRTVQGYDFVNYDNDPDDDNGHGTHVTGIAAAAYNNIGTAGVCGGCAIMPVKVLDGNNAGDWFAVAQGIVYATDSGADIINLSLGSLQSSSVVERAVEYAQEHGLLIVAAAGNSGNTLPFYPAALDGVISVSATKMDNTLWSVSNTGEHITVAAPGENIFSTIYNATDANNLSSRSGTSMAAPYVVGLAGLLLSQNPNQTADELTNIIIGSTTDLGKSGYDEQFGHGLINVFAALNYKQSTETIAGVNRQTEAQIYLPFTTKD